MAKNQLVVGLDIGSTKVCTIVAQQTDKGKNPDVLGVGTVPSRGLRRGVVVDVEETVSSISASIEKAERMSGINIDHVTVSIGGPHLESISNKGVVAISQGEGEITDEDEFRALEAAQAISLPPNREILHPIPQTYTVDDQEGVKDPVGMSGMKLEVTAQVIHISTPIMRNLSKCVFQAGIDIDDFVAVPVAAAKSVLSQRQKELGCVLVDMGGGTTSIAVFEEGNLLSIAVVPIGANHITNDIAIGLRTSVDIAEKVKLEYGHANPSEVSKKDKINLSEFSKLEDSEFTQKEVADIIEARLSEIFSLIKKELNDIKKDGLLPAGVILTGGGAKLPGIVDMAKDSMKLPAQVGFPRDFKGIVDRVDDPAYATCLGLVLWALESEGGKESLLSLGSGKLSGGVKGIKKWFKSFLP